MAIVGWPLAQRTDLAGGLHEVRDAAVAIATLTSERTLWVGIVLHEQWIGRAIAVFVCGNAETTMRLILIAITFANRILLGLALVDTASLSLVLSELGLSIRLSYHANQ